MAGCAIEYTCQAELARGIYSGSHLDALR
jgi:hypothetical protein